MFPGGKQKLHGEHTLLLQKTQEKGRQILLNFPRSFISLGNSKTKSMAFLAFLPVCVKTGQTENQFSWNWKLSAQENADCLGRSVAKFIHLLPHLSRI